MSEKMLSAGDYIASRCSKCKDVTNHTIVAMVANKVVRVECNTCGSVHNYRSAAPTVTPAPRTKTASPQAPRAGKIETEWAAQLSECQASDAINYSIKAAFKPGDVVQHPIGVTYDAEPVFVRGLVLEVKLRTIGVARV